MDDDLLADDGQFKDDGLDELDIDEEAALLGLSDEEIEGERITGDQDLEYVDEDGNPVEIGENNAELYEVANYRSTKRRGTPTEDDVLELDVDAEIESFSQDNPDFPRESPVKTFNERQCKDNLISLTSRNERSKPSLKRQESRHSPDRNASRAKVDHSFSNQSTRHTSVDSFSERVEYDEESEDEGADDDHRERFKSERSNIITLTPAKNRDIPDTLESVINVEETAKVQAFLENEQKRKMRYKGRGPPRMKNPIRQGRPAQSFPSMQHHQPPQFSTPNPVHQQSYQAPSGPSQARKILINPHFRGVRQPPSSEPVIPMNQAPQVSAPPISYDTQQNFTPPLYSQDHAQQVSVSPLPSFSTPPPAMPYKPPDYIQPPQHIQQTPPPIWQQPPPEILPPPVTYAAPPPPLNYGDNLGQVPGYHQNNNYSPNNFQNTAYSPPHIPPPQMAPPQNINYNQPPPPVHLQPPPHTPAPFTSAPPTNVTHMHFQTSQPIQQQNIQQNMQHQNMQHQNMHQQNIQQQNMQQQSMQQQNMQQQNMQHQNRHQKPYQEQRNVSCTQSPNFQRKIVLQNQRFNRLPEKRPSNANIKHVPMKQPRLEHQPRKNVHVNSSNIREIPLIDTLPTTRKQTNNPAVVEEEDEKTKELRKKIEEQKLLREQILKRKEERRRQMAAQRLMDLKKRQAEQNYNVISVVARNEEDIPVKVPVQPAIKAKVSVKERIGAPMSNPVTPGKKKVIVVRKKAIQPANNVATSAQQNKVVGIGQRLSNQPVRPPQKIQLQKKPIAGPETKPNQVLKQSPKVVPTTQPKQAPQQKANQPNKTLATAAAKKIIAKSKPNAQQKQKGNILHRLGNRGSFHRISFNHPRPQHQQGPRLPPSPRFNGPRTPLPFMEHRMRFPGPMNDIRLPGPPFEDQRQLPFDHRPLPFEDQRPPSFHDQIPVFEDQRHPPFHNQRPPPFQEQRPPLLPFHPPEDRTPFNHFMFEPNHPRFRMQGPGFQDLRPMGIDMFQDRFPRPQFQNQIMRPQMYETNRQMFQRPRFNGPNPKQRANNQQKKAVIGNKNPQNKTSPDDSPVKTVVTTAEKDSKTQVVSAKVQNPNQQIVSNATANSNAQSVSVENLSSSTSENQLKKLCSAVGVVENIQLMKDQRKAVIRFKESSQALNFQKKFQRYMLDLAMIQVSLIST